MHSSSITFAAALSILSSLATESTAADPPKQNATTPAYATHDDLSYYVQPDGRRKPLMTSSDWNGRRKHILVGMERAMGPLPHPALPVPLNVEIIEEAFEKGILRRKLAYHTDRPTQTVKAWLLMPSGAKQRKLPAVLCLHQTTPNGKDSPVGLSDRPTLHYARELARRGYVTLSPDYPSFGEHTYDFETDGYVSGSMKAIYDNRRAIDVLESLPAVDPKRIGCIGHSLGGHNSMFTAVFDERIKAVVTSCGFTAFRKYKGGDLHGWSSARYMPRIGDNYHYSPSEMPFDFHEVLAAIAPRGVFIVAPVRDDNFDVEGVRECVAAARPIFRLLGHPERLQVVYPDAPHDFPDKERQQSYEFLDATLKPATE